MKEQCLQSVGVSAKDGSYALIQCSIYSILKRYNAGSDEKLTNRHILFQNFQLKMTNVITSCSFSQPMRRAYIYIYIYIYMVFLRVHTLYLSADNLIHFKSLSVVSYDGNSPLASHSHVTSPLGIFMYSAWNPKDNYG